MEKKNHYHTRVMDCAIEISGNEIVKKFPSLKIIE